MVVLPLVAREVAGSMRESPPEPAVDKCKAPKVAERRRAPRRYSHAQVTSTLANQLHRAGVPAHGRPYISDMLHDSIHNALQRENIDTWFSRCNAFGG